MSRKHKARPKGKRTASTAKAMPGTLGEDLLIGIDNIAAFLGQPRRRAQHWANARLIPLTKVGFLWTGTKSVLTAHFSGGDAA
jgi:hypothetical protein